MFATSSLRVESASKHHVRPNPSPSDETVAEKHELLCPLHLVWCPTALCQVTCLASAIVSRAQTTELGHVRTAENPQLEHVSCRTEFGRYSKFAIPFLSL